MNSTNLKPANNGVLAKVFIPDNVQESGLYVEAQEEASKFNIEFYTGEVLTMGKEANNKSQCPGLEIGDKIVFSQFAGYTPPTKDAYTKLINGHDIVAIIKDYNMKKENVKPTLNRILVELISEEKYTKDGLLIASENDPREKVVQKGKILKLGPNAKGVKKGDIAYFDPYVGNMIVNKNDMQLKTIHDHDLLFTIDSL
jgi:co-chaperonin GroES (HSP10)